MPIIYRGYNIKKLLLVLIFPFASLYAVDFETNVSFRDFPWGTSMDEFIRRTGNPISREETNGLVSLAWENIDVNGYRTCMIAYFSGSGLQGGTYYFLTSNMDELKTCYSKMQQELGNRYGPTELPFDNILNIRELRPYESAWLLPSGYVHLKVDTRKGEPLALWYFSRELSRQVFGERDPVTALKR
jgi:hypothetical protein